MNDANLETLAEIRGFFRAFEWVNGKTNHGYCFEVFLAPKNADIHAAVGSHLAKENPKRLSVTEVDDWREHVSQTLIRWLLMYLNDHPASGCLTDQSNTFSLSMPSCQKQMVDPLIDQIESLSLVQSAHAITIETDGFYACEYTDIVLVATDHHVFLHFDVCD